METSPPGRVAGGGLFSKIWIYLQYYPALCNINGLVLNVKMLKKKNLMLSGSAVHQLHLHLHNTIWLDQG
jgi:hypothetical protein